MNRPSKFAGSVLLVSACAFFAALSSSALAQESQASQASTRIESIEEQQREKARNLSPAEPPRAEQVFYRYVGEDPLNKYLGGIPGLHLRFGGLPSGGGFSLGPEYLRPDLANGQVHFRISAIGSRKAWYLVDTELQFPHLGRRYLDVSFRGRRLDANSIDFYGPGPDSQKAGRTDYRREENVLDFSLAFNPVRRYLNVGFAAGYLWFNVGPGESPGINSAEKQYTPGMAPGIDRQTNYLRTVMFLEMDSVNNKDDPVAGTHFLAKFSRFSDRKYDQYSFRQIESSIEQYLPFFNRKRVIALRARSVLSYPDAGSSVPFYLQPTLGGVSDLRGYRRYRFYDNNSFLLNAEYRWEVFTLMDAVLFADAGKVFHRDGDFNLKNCESDVGFGFRFKTWRDVVFRIDTAFSHEGFGLWFVFDHVF